MTTSHFSQALHSDEEMFSHLTATRNVTCFGAAANLLLAAVKFFAGVYGHSQVLVADAVHSLSDLITDAAVLFGSKYWSKGADGDHPHGHAKIESLVTFFIGFALAMVGSGLVWNAVISLVDYLHEPPQLSPSWLPLAAGILSIVVKEYLYRITVTVGMRYRSSAVIANAWHHRSDALSSIPAVIAVGACLILGNQYSFLDPVATVVVASMIIYAAWNITAPTLAVLLDAGVSEDQQAEISRIILEFSQVHSLHRLRTRRVGPEGVAVDLHIQVHPEMTVYDAHHLYHQIQHALYEKSEGVVEVFVHVEPDKRDSEI